MSKHGEYASERRRYWWFVQKVCNLPENWEQLFCDLLVPGAYILHDKDYYTADDVKRMHDKIQGELKDAHVHFLQYFPGKRTYSGVLALNNGLGFNLGKVEPVPHKDGALAYMLHLNRPEKHLYGFDELKIVNGLKVNFADLAEVDFADVMDYCEGHSITRLGQLLKATERTEPPLFRYICGHFSLVAAFLGDERDAKRIDNEKMPV